MTPPAKPRPAAVEDTATRKMAYDDNGLALQLFGAHHAHLALIEQKLAVTINARGNTLSITGPEDAVDAARTVLEGLYSRLDRGLEVDREEVEAVLRMAMGPGGDVRDADLVIRTRKRRISPRTPTQADYVRAMDDCELVFGLGPAGTGKTYLAVAKALEKLAKGEVDRIVLTRPAVEAGEQLGFLPGDMRDKVDPYLRPLYDALHDMLPEEQVATRMERGEIEVAPLAFMRGRTLANAFAILDEAQNTTAVQMKMFLTRLGENSRMVITGDLSQVDLPSGRRSGLREAVEILNKVSAATFIYFTDADVVRHSLVTEIVRAYDEAERIAKTSARYEKGESTGGPDRPSEDD